MIKRFWRWLRGQCANCGRAPRVVRNPNDIYAQDTKNCRRCNKAMTWARFYGAGPMTLARLNKGCER